MKTPNAALAIQSLLAGDGRLAKTGGYYLAFIILGMMSASLGPTLPGLAEQTHSTLGDLSLLFTARAMGYLLGALVGGRIYDRVAGHPIFAIVLGTMAVMMAGIPAIPLLWGLISVLLLMGMAESLVDVGGNTLLVWVHRRNVGPFMNGLHFCFGLGAFLSPLIVARVVAMNDNITWAYWILAIMIVPVAIVFGFLPGPHPHSAGGESHTKVTNHFLVGGVALFFFLYAGAEVAFGGWIYTYAVTLGLADKAVAAYLTSAFWGALTVGRLLSIPLAARIRPVILLFSSLAGCVLSLGMMLLWPSSFLVLGTGVFGAGFFMSVIFPTTLSFSERRMTITGTVTGCFFVGSSLGAMAIPWLVGRLLDSYGPHTMLWILLADLVAAIIVLAGISFKDSITQASRLQESLA